ncbi:hypothetical protein [Arthrobacter sp. HLT1-21]
MMNNSRTRALRSIQQWTVGGLLVAGLATAGMSAGLVAGEQATQQPAQQTVQQGVVSTGGQGFSRSAAPLNAPQHTQQAQPQVTTKGS